MAKELENAKGAGGRGGRRAGAGRPNTGSKLYTFRAPATMAQLLDGQENRTEFIKSCILNAVVGSHGEACPATAVRGLHLPYFDLGIKAGFPVPLDNDEKSQDVELLQMLCPHPEASYLIRVEGDSMTDAGIFDGDIIIVDKSRRTPGPAEVAVCELNGSYTLKRFVKRGNEGWLVPANPDYPEIRVTEEDTFSVWGTVTYIIHKPRG